MSTDGKHTELNQYFQPSKLLFYKKEIKMAASPVRQKTSFHARSNSLPSRPHPIISEFDENICRVRDSQATSKSSSSSSIGHKLSSLQDLYDSVDKFLQLPLTQQGLAQQRNQKCVDELLEGSLRLLDTCTLPRMHCCNQKNSVVSFNLLLAEDKEALTARSGNTLHPGK